MAESSQDHSTPDFGTNQWLVEEMYERYREDPTSVDATWVSFFQTGDGVGLNGNSGANGTNGTAPAKAAPVATAAPTPPPTSPESTQPPAAKTQPPTATAPEEKAPDAPAPVAPVPATPPVKAKPAPSTPAAKDAPAAGPGEVENVVLRGAAARTVANMDASLSVPTATSVRSVPVKLLFDQRVVINNHLARARGGKVSFTHLIGWAIVKALKAMPEMNTGFEVVNGKPNQLKPEHINFGLAIDLKKPDGSRTLLVPSIKAADTMTFAEFWAAYETMVSKARDNKLTVADFQGTTVSLTNPGGIGTNHSIPRLMQGQGVIIGVGSMEYPPEFQGASEHTLAQMAISKMMTLTSTYDHRVIQGAQSGEFLKRIHALLLGEDGFYDEIFRALKIPYEPIRWAQDIPVSHDDEVHKQARVLELIHAFRVRGHLMADTNPLDSSPRMHTDLDTASHGLTLWDLDREFATGSFKSEKRFMKLREILGILRDSYARTIGIEYMHIQEPTEREWFQERVERPHTKPPREEQLRILQKLNQAEAFETFLQTKFVGQKRFSLEGGETTIPFLDEICEAAASDNLEEVCIGMAHRGRLNALVNIAGKRPSQVFREFEGNIDPRTVQGSGDVKYHLGVEGEFTSGNGDKIKVSIAANPSHLEVVDPVLEGITRAKQDRLNRGQEYPVLPVLVHGDAAFAGQGVVAETLNLSQLRGYRTGGTIHLIVNNQVGFTTSPSSSRSSTYCTDVARMIQAPVFHVNGDDPEACIRVAQLAYEYRRTFHKDIVIDLVCYRRRGHNEGDDPSFTQPLMYDTINAKKSVRKLYTEALVGRGDITLEEAEAALTDYQAQLERNFAEVKQAASDPDYTRTPDYPEKPEHEGELITAITPETMKAIADAYTNVPEGFTVHPKVLPQLQRRAQSISAGPIDWGTGEILAMGSLLLDGRPVRLAGQDTRRGTFSSRFATIIDRTNAHEWTPLSHVGDEQATFYVYDSLLSEYAALGFEYGYSVARPEALTMWEAQFGDFVNGAQSVIDEYISSGETKWGQKSGVVLLLPHGYEGQGPDHSSARIERFLDLCADNAMTVAQPSTPASYFHLLRRQNLQGQHRPLIVFTPKSMLRSKAAASQPDDFTSGSFRPVIGDDVADPSAVERVLVCSGRITWDLMAEREKRESGQSRTAIVRLEQIYPRPLEELKAELAKYPNAREVRFVQDEPANQGPWPHIALHFSGELGGLPLLRVSRPESSAPSVGSHNRHVEEQATLMQQAFS
ncbi:multifunctional oxoglutarate decarboxylase/oxoglutarate dehydrogenase thiamine pyrophosphate-binding subunit/dihydrolipoyllysine-residue succinyltransferase subunit [Aeromicrobium chenweiae]|uniref:Multifunctional oxoglutarate decarboxylase/oxoglutarate dehydrogenase thiamine pyrophosphate-binding subunit/dihydrolipoyllysine-residue succinyltransferase subunit n=1 Tax=Aeromicrobium chenweiae TaxID=2079793 RepID=A0A2S0WNT9_9ACTN|nr:multifunctional oxoglutarate decarboxylase/oxoglutarate dehydrogenase thiamine pyrophosphate-binding subunit/dihydrolipoyllysine-residue succinyltransferase subunit [Aeromicrobium chenweiae]AWB92976.1 multifunctional oxoglutarate decarboxylase/oxoglutarate dehydrogenase thiamine pyrophosphate-binding subunit/dihydrolipoyllysine-residue succinyltransferase subunit [Aeromicrobium chenweiae]TGN34550.1 multifunctional oxoglutarate decarboxylase/oxoglutarate dehydrogenase thiamine pyrophosphate-bin